MKKQHAIIILLVVLAICVGIAVKMMFDRPKDPVIPAENDSAQKEDQSSKDSNNSENTQKDDQSFEASIQEDQGDLIITIPDDQESAGE